jgi:HAMP domain-containing protein
VSFRLRVLGLVILVALIAIGATAYLVFVQTSRQANQSAAADQETVSLIVGELTNYAAGHGTWVGLGSTVRELKTRTGQRIKLVTESGEVVADSDVLDGRTARAVNAPPILVDPTPTLRPSVVTARVPSPAVEATAAVVRRYRLDLRFATCMTGLGLGVLSSPGDSGVPEYQPEPDAERDHPAEVERCRVEADAREREFVTPGQFKACQEVVLKRSTSESEIPSRDPPSPTESVWPTGESTEVPFPSGVKVDLPLYDCLQKAFRVTTADVAPAPLRIYLGAIDERRPAFTPGPVIAAAVLVALLAIAGTVLLSRRVLRPIATLTAASERLGEGDLSRRVPAKGRDELATLARSFNRMADSLQRGEDRQRRMVADVAHELRSPLANLRGYL